MGMRLMVAGLRKPSSYGERITIHGKVFDECRQRGAELIESCGNRRHKNRAVLWVSPLVRAKSASQPEIMPGSRRASVPRGSRSVGR